MLPEPKVLVFPVTYRCNARCIMCSIGGMKWNDRPISFFEPFFASNLTDSLESINITGGEPTLRTDLPELVEMIVGHSPRLKEILLSTNGLRPQAVVQRVEGIARNLRGRAALWVFVSLDSLDSSAEVVRGFKNAGALAQSTILQLHAMQEELAIRVAISCTITRSNFHALADVNRFARERGIFVDFPYATVNTTYINSAPKASQFVTSADQDREIAAFYAELAEQPNSVAALSYYRRMQHFLSTGELPHGDCVYRSGLGILLEPDGKVRVCGMSDDSLIGDLSVESVEQVLSRTRPAMWKHCANCTTNSYSTWTADAQAEAKQAMLAKLRATRSAMREAAPQAWPAE